MVDTAILALARAKSTARKPRWTPLRAKP